MRILAVNSGSSSVKCALFDAYPAANGQKHAGLQRLFSGTVRQIGTHPTLEYRDKAETVHREKVDGLRTHEAAVKRLVQLVEGNGMDAVGHRIVHGGPWFTESVPIDDKLLSRFHDLVQLAPLHNPACLAGIRQTQTMLGTGMPMVAVFDTAFHRDLPPYAYSYALPRDVVEQHHVRRYGFHGLAHGSSTALYAQVIGKPVDRVDLVTLHLGNGCSAAAISGGRSVDTSMGFTPLEGLVMGTRCGDIDPALVSFLAREAGLSCDDIDELLNHRSGLAGMSGLSSDMAELLRAEQAGHAGAHLAIETFCYRARKYVGAYLAVLGQVDAVVFSGGIGEHAPEIRARICDGMQWCGLLIDHEANHALTRMDAGMIRRISPPKARIAVFVAAVDEEAAIARETLTCLTR